MKLPLAYFQVGGVA